MSNTPTLRPATEADYKELSTLLGVSTHTQRHLDWRAPYQWLGNQPFWVLEETSTLLAAMACPAEVSGVSWVRLFASAREDNVRNDWDILLEKNLEALRQSNVRELASMAVFDWYRRLLDVPPWQHKQDIVILSWTSTATETIQPIEGLSFLPLESEDLPAVAKIDAQAFENLWQNPLSSLQLAYRHSGYARVIKAGDDIIAYQISTIGLSSAHLARLAVAPKWQGKRIGRWLVRDLQAHFWLQNYGEVTVNTQSDNHASLSLYHSLGFVETGDRFPVFVHPIG
jgi:ribosomal protein S18 acetylase RimI-like enzyme